MVSQSVVSQSVVSLVTGSGRVRFRAGLVAIAHAWFGDQPAGPGGIRLELAAQLRHVQPQVAGGVGVPGPPHLGQQLVAAEQLARVPQQHLEQVPFGRGEPDVILLGRGAGSRLAVRGACLAGSGMVAAARRHRRLPGDALGGQVDDQVAELDLGQVLHGPGAPDRRTHAGEQFFYPERFGDVVIGARVERLHLVHAVGASGQHDDRRLRPAAQALDHLHPIQVGQAKIEDHQVGRIPAGHFERLGSGRRDVHVVVAHPEVDPQRPQDLRLVIDD